METIILHKNNNTQFGLGINNEDLFIIYKQIKDDKIDIMIEAMLNGIEDEGRDDFIDLINDKNLKRINESVRGFKNLPDDLVDQVIESVKVSNGNIMEVTQIKPIEIYLNWNYDEDIPEFEDEFKELIDMLKK